MSWAHKGSNLALEDMLICVPDDAAYFPFDHHLASTKLVYPEGYDNHTVTDYGLYTGTNLCATLRKGEGRFGGAVAVEEGTENLVINPLFEGGLSHWGTQNRTGGSDVWVDTMEHPLGDKVVIIEKVEGGGDVSPYQSVGGKVTDVHTVSFYTKRLDPSGSDVMRIRYGNSSVNHFVTITDDWKRHSVTFTSEDTGNNNLIFYISGPVGEVAITGIQVEQKPFATSFVDGTRPDGILAYPIALKDDHTIACYRKSHTDEDYRHVAKRSDGTVFVDGVEDSEYDVGWIAGRNLLEGNWDLTWEDSHPSYQYLLRPQIQSIIDKVSIGDTLTFSFDVEAEADTLLLVYDSNGHPGIGFGSQSINVKQGKQRVSFTKTLVAGSKNTEQWYMDVYNNNNGVKFSISKIKIEKGSTATDWTPAPEDLGYDGDTLMLSNQTGIVDELMISRGVLSPEEIRAIYHGQRPLYDPNRIDHIVG